MEVVLHVASLARSLCGCRLLVSLVFCSLSLRLCCLLPVFLGVCLYPSDCMYVCVFHVYVNLSVYSCLSVSLHLTFLSPFSYSPVDPDQVMAEFLATVVPFLEDATSTTRRRGAAEACYHAVERMALAVIPYIVILVIPIMGRMSDFDPQVRVWVSASFRRKPMKMKEEEEGGEGARRSAFVVRGCVVMVIGWGGVRTLG